MLEYTLKRLSQQLKISIFIMKLTFSPRFIKREPTRIDRTNQEPTKSQPELRESTGIYDCNYLNVPYFHSVPAWPGTVTITSGYRSVCGSLMAYLDELVRFGEMNQFNLVSHCRLIIEIFIYRVYYLTNPSGRLV